MSYPVPLLLNQRRQGIPDSIKSGARALYAVKGTAFNSTKFLDQSPLHLGTRRAGQQGRCYTADGTDDLVDLGTDFVGTGDVTITAWINASSFGGAGEGRVIDNGRTILFINSTSNRLRFTSDGGTTQARADNAITLGQWKHISVVRVGAVATLYVNGVDVTSASSSGTPVVASSNLIILNNEAGSRSFEGGLFDLRIYSEALTSSEIIYIYTFGASGYDPTNASILAHYKCDEQGGTTSYDSSGNGNNGTITNATLANFHTTQDIYSFQNQVGYNLSGTVYIPRDESDAANDVLGNPLAYTGVRPNDGALINSSCLDLNGTNQAVRVADNTALDITDNLTVSIWAKNNNSSLSASEWLFSKYDASSNKREWGLFVNSSQKISLALGDPNDGTLENVSSSDDAVIPQDINHFVFTFSSGEVKLYVNGSSVIFTNTATPPNSLFTSNTNLYLGSVFSGGFVSQPWDGQIFDARIYAGDSTVLTAAQILSIYEDGASNVEFEGQELRARYACSEGAGTSVLDYSGKGNDGTIENAVSNWGVNQDILPLNLLDGFSLYEHASSDPIRVKFVSGSPRSFTPPTGYTLTAHYAPGNFRIPAETEINFNPDSTPEMGGQLGSYTAPAAHAFGDGMDPGATDQGFARQTSDKEDRFAIFAEPQTGAALTTIERWVL